LHSPVTSTVTAVPACLLATRLSWKRRNQRRKRRRRAVITTLMMVMMMERSDIEQSNESDVNCLSDLVRPAERQQKTESETLCRHKWLLTPDDRDLDVESRSADSFLLFLSLTFSSSTLLFLHTQLLIAYGATVRPRTGNTVSGHFTFQMYCACAVNDDHLFVPALSYQQFSFILWRGSYR
jgi:hypothetical protein